MSNEFRIINGIVFDPTNEIDGKVCDIFIKDGKIVSEVSEGSKSYQMQMVWLLCLAV